MTILNDFMIYIFVCIYVDGSSNVHDGSSNNPLQVEMSKLSRRKSAIGNGGMYIVLLLLLLYLSIILVYKHDYLFDIYIFLYVFICIYMCVFRYEYYYIKW
jgi:hypothetical protein